MKKYLEQTILVLTLIFGFTEVYSQAHNSPGCVSSAPNNTSALGYNTQGIGINSFAAGKESIANGLNSFAVGYTSTANGVNSIAIGESCYSGSQSFAIGQNAKARSDNSFAFGRYVETDAIGPGAMVIGATNTASGILKNTISNSLMIGFSSTPIFFANSTKIGIATTNPLYTLDVNGSSLFRNEVRIASLVSPKGKRVVITDEEGKLSFAEEFTGIPGDNLGNHIATTNLNMGDFSIYNGTKDIESSRIGLILTPENNALLTNGKETSFTINSGSAQRSSLWLTNDLTGGFGLMLNSDNLTGGIYHNISDPKAIINFTSSKVGIGVEPIVTSDYRLFVAGGILTDEVLIKLESEWFDYVFEEDYELMSLRELEVYIKQHKHLPDIPSANEVKENGIQIGEMNALLLKKIEELTIHLIAQQKEIEKLKSEQR